MTERVPSIEGTLPLNEALAVLPGVARLDRGAPEALVESFEVVAGSDGVQPPPRTLLVVLTADPAVLATAVATSGAAALLVPEEAVTPALRTAARKSGVPLLAAAPEGRSWARLLGALHELFDPADEAPLLTSTHDSLADLTNAVGDRLANPITVERADGELLAYSRQGSDVDSYRTASILERRMPPEVQARLRSLGAFATIDAADGPVALDPSLTAGTHRVATAIRNRGNVLGYVWLLETAGPLTTDERAILKDFADQAARFIAREDSQRERERRARELFLAGVLEGTSGAGTRRQARTLGIDSAMGLHVLVVRSPDQSELRKGLYALEPQLTLLADSTVVSAVQEEGLVLFPERAGAVHLMQAAERCRTAAEGGPCAVGVSATGTLADLPRLFREASEAALVSLVVDESRRARRFDDLGAYHVLTRGAADLPSLSPHVSTLLAHDRQHGSELSLTVQTYLDAALNGRLAARALQIHHNTLAYRLERAAAISGLDLTDPDQRLSASLELRRQLFLNPQP